MNISDTEIIKILSQQGRGRITSITIENFKCIGDAVTIPIRPITLLFGKNSAGKSTVLHALRYWFEIWNETWYKLTEQNTPELSAIEMSGGYTIDLTNFPSLVHRHNLDRKIRIRITYAPNVTDKQNQSYHLLWNEVVTSWKEEDTHVESVLLGCVINGEEMCFIISGEPSNDAVVNPNGRVLIPKKLDASGQSSGMALAIGTAFGAAFPILGIIAGFEGLSSRQKPKTPDAIQHLGPFRELPPPHYDKLQTSDELQNKLRRWEKGLGAWDTLARDPKVIKKTNHYMQDVLKLGYSINHWKRNSTNLEQWPCLHDENNDIDVHPSDVGVGIAQIIPVVVGALDDDQNSIIFAVEQPELHLHPAAQVALGDVFIDGIKNGNRTMLIETHSEHLLLRLLRRVRETTRRSRHQTTELEQTAHELTPNDLSVVYVRPTPAGVKFTPLTVTDNGDFDAPWPEGFFEERDSELF